MFQCINVTAGITFNDSVLHFSCGVMMICQCNSVLLQDFFLKELSLCKSGEANDSKRAEEKRHQRENGSFSVRKKNWKDSMFWLYFSSVEVCRRIPIVIPWSAPAFTWLTSFHLK